MHITYSGIDDLLVSLLENYIKDICEGDCALAEVFSEEHFDWQLSSLCIGLSEAYFSIPESADTIAIVGYICRQCRKLQIHTSTSIIDPETCLRMVVDSHQGHDYLAVYLEV